MSTLTIDMTNLKKVKSSYNLKGKDTLVIKTTGNSGFISGIDSISASNNTLSIKINGKTVKFTNISEPSTLTIQAYSTETNSIYYEADSQTFYNEFSKNWIPAKNGTKVVASVFDEDIDVSEGYVPTEKNLAKNIGLNINAGAGDDTIKATEYNDTITGGIGTNNIIYSSSDFGNDIINLTKNEILNITGLDFTGIDVDDRFKQGENKNKNDLIVTSKYGTITIKNYFSKNTGATVNINNDNLAKTPLMKQITAEYFYDNTKQKYISKKYTGSALADKIDASGLQQETKSKTQKDGTIIKSGVTINSGLGDDIIKGSQFNDTISGGIGENKIIYTTENFGDDVINLTKGETLHLTLLNSLTPQYSKGKNKNDLVLTTNYGTITLKNYLMKNTGATVYINGEDISKSAALDEIDKEYFLKDNGKLKTSKYTGTALADVVDVSGVNVAAKTTKDKAGNIISQTGLTLNTGLGDDKITGTQFDDTITGGLGENTIVVKNEKFGTDTVNLTKGEKLTIDMSAYVSPEFLIEKNDLNIKTDNGTLILKNFAKSNVIGVDGYVKVLLSGDKTLNLNEDNIFNYTNTSERFILGKNNVLTFTGTRFSETINTSGIDKPLIIKAGMGTNTIFVDNSNSFDITIAEEKLNAKNIIKFKNDIDTNYAFTRHGNDLIISKETNSKVTINGYFIERGDKTKYADIVFKIKNETKTFEQLVDITGKEFITQVSGKYTSNVDGAYIVGSDGKDTIYGGAGSQTINGGKGNDTIYGGTGKVPQSPNFSEQNTIVFDKDCGNDTVVYDGTWNVLKFSELTTEENFYQNVFAWEDGNNLKLSYNNNTITLKNYKGHELYYDFRVGDSTIAMEDFLNNTIYKVDPTGPVEPTEPTEPTEPEKDKYELANMTMGTDGADTLVQTFGENNYSAYGNQLNILKDDYGATDEWLEKYCNDLSAKARDVSRKYSNVQGVLSDISWYEYLISNYDNPNYTGDTYFKHWSKEYYIDQLAQKNADAYGLTYTWETYRKTKLTDYTEGSAEYNEALEDLNYSLEYARYQNAVDKYHKYQSYAQNTSAIPTFRDIAIANGYTSENGYEYYEAKQEDILRTLNGFKGSKQIYEELLDDYAKTHEDFATLRQNYKNNNTTDEDDYNSAVAEIREHNSDIQTAYDKYQVDLAKYNQYSEYAHNYYNAEYLGKDYNCDVEGKEYVSFRQEAEAERENKIIHDYYQKQYRYRTGEEYWYYKAELMNREINGYEGTASRYNYFYMLSRDGNPLSIYYDLYREVRDEYNDYVDEYNTYASYIHNWDNADYKGEAGDDATITDSDVWSSHANNVNVELNGRIYEYNTATNELNGIVQYIKEKAPSETALQILTHLTTSGTGGIIIAKNGDDDITIGHIEPNADNVSRGNVFAMGQGGNDIYRLENYGTEGAYGEPIGVTIYDHKGTNTVHLNSLELNSGNIGIYANVTLVKDANGEYVTDTNGNYQYTLENFKTYLGSSSGFSSCMERSPLKNGDAGYSLLLVDAKTYSNKYAFNYGAMDQAGIKFDTETINHIDKIYAKDGKYITQDQLREMFQKTANQLAKMGYDSFMAAVQTNDTTEKQHNLSIFTSSEVQGSLEWVTNKTVNTTGATEGLTGTDRNDNLTSTSANETFDLKLGNDTVTFEGEFGHDIIQSSSTVDNNGNARQADTLNLQEYSIEDRTLVLERNGNDLVLKAYADDKTTINGIVTYKNFLSGDVYNSRKFVLNAKDHTYMIWFNEAQERANKEEDIIAMDIDDQANNFYNIRFIKSLDNGLVRIDASENRSSYIVLDDTPIVLYKNKNIGTKEVISYGNADDQYREALSETTDLIINDNGGNDSLEITGGYYDTIGDAHMRYFFDITDEGVVSDAKHIIWTDNFYTPNKEEHEDGSSRIIGHSYATENLIKLLNNDHEHMKGAITIYGDIEEIENDNHPSLAYKYPMSYNKVIESTLVDVVPWLKENGYSSVTDALTQLQAEVNAKQSQMNEITVPAHFDTETQEIVKEYPAQYTQLKAEQDAIQAKIDELLGFYNKGYEVIINTNIIGTDVNDEITATSYTKYIEAKEGNDTIDLTTSHSNVKLVYDFTRGDGHDTIINAYRKLENDTIERPDQSDKIYVNIGDMNVTPKFRTDGWDLILEMYTDSQSTTNPDGSIRIKDYFKMPLSNWPNARIDKLVITDTQGEHEMSINSMLQEEGAIINTDGNIILGTAGKDNLSGTNSNDIIYTNGAESFTDQYADVITSSSGNDTYYLTPETYHKSYGKFTYTVGSGDDTIYGASYLTYLTLNYNDEDISMEFRKSDNNDIRMVFFDYEGNDRGSITVKESDIHWNDDGTIATSYGSTFLNHGTADTFFIKKNNDDIGTAYKLADLVKQYIVLGGSMTENDDSSYLNYIKVENLADDTILQNSGKVDYIVIPENCTNYEYEVVGDDLKITVTTDSVEKSIFINDYAKGDSSLKALVVSGEYEEICWYDGAKDHHYGTKGDDVYVYSKDKSDTQVYHLFSGNDIVEYSINNGASNYEAGTNVSDKAEIISSTDSTNTDIIRFKDIYFDKLIFGYNTDGTGITIKTEGDINVAGGKAHKSVEFTYDNFISGNTPKLSVESNTKAGTYTVKKFNGVQSELDLRYIGYNGTEDDYVQNSVTYIQATSGKSKVYAGSNSQILTNGGADIEAVINRDVSATNVIVTQSQTSNDTYCIYGSDYANVRIYDNGGNDSIRLNNYYAGSESSNPTEKNLRLLFNVNKDGSTDNKFILINHGDNTSGILNDGQTLLGNNYTWGVNKGTIIVEANPTGNNKVGIEELLLCNTEYQDMGEYYQYIDTPVKNINLESWYNAIKTEVVNWLSTNADWMTENNLNSTADVFNFYNNNSAGYDMAKSLINVYENYNAGQYLIK